VAGRHVDASQPLAAYRPGLKWLVAVGFLISAFEGTSALATNILPAPMESYQLNIGTGNIGPLGMDKDGVLTLVSVSPSSFATVYRYRELVSGPASFTLNQSASFALTGRPWDRVHVLDDIETLGDTLIVPEAYYPTSNSALLHGVSLYSKAGTFLSSWETGRPIGGLAVDSTSRRLYLFLNAIHDNETYVPPEVAVYTTSGARETSFPVALAPSGDSTALGTGMTIRRDRQLVLGFVDDFGTTLRRYTLGGVQGATRSFDSVNDGSVSTPCVDASSLVYATNYLTQQLLIMDQNFNTIRSWAPPDPLRAGWLVSSLNCQLYANNSGSNLLRTFSVDADSDGLCDAWETYGVTRADGGGQFWFGGAPDSADVLHKDVFVEVDAMENHSLVDASCLALVNGFWAGTVHNPDGTMGMNLHLQRDESGSGIPDAAWTSANQATNYRAIWDAHFGTAAEHGVPAILEAKALGVRYALMVHGVDPVGGAHASWGQAEQDGNEFIVALLPRIPVGSDPVIDWKFQAGTFLHELGHTLGLSHGGIYDDDDWKPNYRSVMNHYWVRPLKPLQNQWKATFSRRAFYVVDESAFAEYDGFGGNFRDYTFVGPPFFDNEGKARVKYFAEGGPIDINGDNIHTVLQRDFNKRFPAASETTLDPDVLTVLNRHEDYTQLLYGDRYGDLWGSGHQFLVNAMDLDADRLDALAAMVQDCDGNGASDSTEIANGAPDIDCDGIPDKCGGVRATVSVDLVTLCPGGDADSIGIDVDLTGICKVDIASAGLRLIAKRTPASDTSVVIWSNSGTVLRDTLALGGYDANTHTGHFGIKSGSGCGVLTVDIYAESLLVASGVTCQVRGLDRDARVSGAVDKFDVAAFDTCYAHGGNCAGMDLDGSGLITEDDRAFLVAHKGHHVYRHLSRPNGGESFLTGEEQEIRWQRGFGDSSRVSLYLERTSKPGIRRVIAQNRPDTGTYTWGVGASDAPATNYRVEVIHTAGMMDVQFANAVGSDISDGNFTINVGGGCPFVDVLTGDGWQEENSILGRSLTGALGLDGYCVKATPAVVDSIVQLRIREDEQEYTTLDEVRLIAVDHDSTLRAYGVGDRVILGRRMAVATVTTKAGADITGLVDGSGSYFVGEPGETLYVDLTGTRPVAARGLQNVLGGGGFEIDPGDKGGEGGAPQASMHPASLANTDEAILANTGILIQVPDGSATWQTIDHVYPREEFDPHTIEYMTAAEARLVFLDRHKLRFVGSVEFVHDSLHATKQPLVGAVHSRLGDVSGAVGESGNLSTSLTPGDTLNLSFRATGRPPGTVRDHFLLSRGVYTSNLPTAQEQETPKAPLRFALQQNRPNPFSAQTTIGFDLPVSARVTLEIFDLQGRMIRRVVDQPYTPGRWSLQWDRRAGDGTTVHPGIYLYRIQAGQFRDQKKMVLLP
jgi:hypothetical protein